MAYERDPNEIGALWLKAGAKGDYLTGEINGVKVVCFAVQKRSEKSPTWRVLKAQPRGERAPYDANARPDDEIPFAWLLPMLLALGGSLIA
jgi:hypothetical protein